MQLNTEIQKILILLQIVDLRCFITLLVADQRFYTSQEESNLFL